MSLPSQDDIVIYNALDKMRKLIRKARLEISITRPNHPSSFEYLRETRDLVEDVVEESMLIIEKVDKRMAAKFDKRQLHET